MFLGAWCLLLLLYEVLTRFSLSRTCWRLVMVFFIQLDLLMLRLVRLVYPPKFKLFGACQKCGVCCQWIMFRPPRWVLNFPGLQRLLVVYHRYMHNFHLAHQDPASGLLIFSCGYLQSDGRCKIYFFRPYLCRNYPAVSWFKPPELLPNCSFQTGARVVAKMRPGRLPIRNPQVAVHHPGGSTLARDRTEEWLTGAEPPEAYEHFAPE